MHSLTQEIRGFSRANLRKQRTRVTTLTGRRIIETWRGACLQVEEVEEELAPGGGYVHDLSADLQVGVVKPWLLLGSQDAAHDLETMRKHKVTHVLNVAYGVQNAFLDDFIYKTISILDLPETDITSYFPECFEFIEKAKIQVQHTELHRVMGNRVKGLLLGLIAWQTCVGTRTVTMIIPDSGWCGAGPLQRRSLTCSSSSHRFSNEFRKTEFC
ncbi:dual specificity protein phosphatase 19 isoform 2-T2 [Porphyrio hochstetteri]